MIKIEKVNNDNLLPWAHLCCELWPNLSINHFINKYPNGHEGYFLAIIDNHYVGFINLSIRHGHVPGAKHKRVAFIEGIYVKENYRRQKIASTLFNGIKPWIKENGCYEIGSKCLLSNEESFAFHQYLGFIEVEKVTNLIWKTNKDIED